MSSNLTRGIASGTRWWVAGLVLLAAAFGAPQSAQAQTYTQSTFPMGMTFIQGQPGTTALFAAAQPGAPFDDMAASVPIPFTFMFFGQPYTSVMVSTNGYLVFPAGQSATDFTNDPLPTAAAPNGIIAAYWDDLIVQPAQGAADEVAWQLQGTAPNRVLVIEYFSVSHVGSTSGWVYAQVQLFEGTNIIELHYPGGTTVPPTASSTIGIENETGTIAVGGPNTMATNTTLPATNFRFTPSGPPPMQPDMTVSNVSLSSHSLAPGGMVTANRTISNPGAATATNFEYRVYFSTDNMITTADTQALTNTLTLASAAMDTTPDMVTVPGGLAPGTYFVGYLLDPANAIMESNESNNTAIDPMQVTIANMAADFRADSVSSGSTTVVQGGSLTATRAFTNTGTASASNFEVGYRLSTDNTITAADPLIGTEMVAGPLATSAQDTGNFTVTIPMATAPGTYFIGLHVDPNDNVTEGNETDNFISDTMSITVNMPSTQPDLNVPSVMTGATTAMAGGTLAVTRSINNAGTTAATGWDYIIVLSDDTTITTADTPVFTGTPGSLAGTSTDTATVTANIPAGLPAGTYFVGVIADPTNMLTESDENNNTGVDTTPVTVSGAPTTTDLVAGTVTLGQSVVPPGSAITVTRTITNGGTTAAGAFMYGVYLSTDNTITTADTLLMSFSPSGLSAGQMDTANVNVTIPAGTADGNYFVGIVVDTGAAIPESDENNNASAALTTLAVSSTAPPTNQPAKSRGGGVCAIGGEETPAPWTPLALLVLVAAGMLRFRRER